MIPDVNISTSAIWRKKRWKRVVLLKKDVYYIHVNINMISNHVDTYIYIYTYVCIFLCIIYYAHGLCVHFIFSPKMTCNTSPNIVGDSTSSSYHAHVQRRPPPKVTLNGSPTKSRPRCLANWNVLNHKLIFSKVETNIHQRSIGASFLYISYMNSSCSTSTPTPWPHRSKRPTICCEDQIQRRLATGCSLGETKQHSIGYSESHDP